MIKCPFCGFDNEDGALFCEQCKSDLSSVAPSAPPAPPPAPEPEPIPMAPLMEDNVPMAAMVEAAPVDYTPLAGFEPTVPMADVMEAPAAPLAEPIPFAPEPAPAPPIGQTPPTLPPPPEPTPAFEPAAAAPAAAAAAAAAPAPAPAPAPAAGGKTLPVGSAPKLLVIRGARVNAEFFIYPGQNFIGRSDDRPVDIDLEDQEPPDRVWTSRQHAVLEWDDTAGILTLEDLNSSNGTYVNRGRAYPGQKQPLGLGDVIQIGTIHLRVKV